MTSRRVTRRAFAGGMAVAGASLMFGYPAGVAGQRPSPVPRSASGDVSMIGVDPAYTNWVPGPAIDGVPDLGERLLAGASFPGGTWSARLLAQGGVVYATGRPEASDWALFALDAVTGDERWRAPEVGALLAIASDAVIIQRLGREDAPDTVAAIALDGSGAELWQVDARAQGRTVVVGNLALVSTSGGPLAIDLATGAVAWDRQDLALGETFDIAVGDGILVGSEPTETNVVRSFSLDSGDALWQVELDRPVHTAPLVAGDSVLVCDPLNLVELDLRTGQERRRIELRQAMPFRGRLALAGSTLIVSDISGLSAIDFMSGETRWTYAPRFGTAFELLLAGATAYLLVYDGASSEAKRAVQAIDLETGTPRWEVPEPGSDAAADYVVQCLIAGDRLWLASMNGLRMCTFSDLPDPGVASPVQGNTFTSEAAGFSYTWTAEWEPGDTDWFLGEDGLRLQSTDGQALVTQYVEEGVGQASAEEVAWTIAGVPPGGEVSLDPSPLIVAFPRTFGPDTSRLRALEAVEPPVLPAPVPADAGVALVLAHTALNPPFDRMLVLVVTVPLPERDSMLVFELATADGALDVWTGSFMSFFEHLTLG